jgi:hypothetical protein
MQRIARIQSSDAFISFRANDPMQCPNVCKLLVDLGEDLRVLEEVVLFVSNLDWRTSPSREKNPVAGLDGDWGDLTVLMSARGYKGSTYLAWGTGADSNDSSLRERVGSC